MKTALLGSSRIFFPTLAILIFFLIPASGSAGIISGTIMADDGNSTPLAGVCMRAYDSQCDDTDVGSAVSAEDGSYAITIADGVGTAYLEVNPACADLSYASEWFDSNGGTSDCSQAVGVAEGATNVDFALVPTVSISGIVTDDSQPANPLANVLVGAYSDICHNGYVSEGVTDATGNYTIAGIPQNTMVYVWADSSTAASNYTRAWYDGNGGDPECGIAQPVNAGFNDVNFVLQAAGSISGSISDAGDEPIAGMHVFATLYDPVHCNGRWLASADTDASGFYQIDHIPPGDVVIRTCAECSGLNHVNEYFDDTLDCTQAQPITVVSGSTATGHNFKLDTGGSVSGHVSDSVTGLPISNLHVYAQSETCNGLWLGGGDTDETGFYRITSLPPGPVFLRTEAQGSGLNYVDESWDNAPDCDNATEIVVVAGSEIIDRDFLLDPGGIISGHVYQAGTSTPIAGVYVEIYSDSCHNGHMYGVQTDDNGYFEFTGLPNGGQFVLRADPGNGQNYISQWYDNIGDTDDCNLATFVTVGGERRILPFIWWRGPVYQAWWPMRRVRPSRTCTFMRPMQTLEIGLGREIPMPAEHFIWLDYRRSTAGLTFVHLAMV